MFKFIIAFNAAYVLGFVLGDAFTGFLFQMAFIAVYALAKLVPGRVWLAIGEACAEMLPWIMIANIDL
jgi:hypothetical protein